MKLSLDCGRAFTPVPGPRRNNRCPAHQAELTKREDARRNQRAKIRDCEATTDSQPPTIAGRSAQAATARSTRPALWEARTSTKRGDERSSVLTPDSGLGVPAGDRDITSEEGERPLIVLGVLLVVVATVYATYTVCRWLS
jgi:hypothetical protein